METEPIPPLNGAGMRHFVELLPVGAVLVQGARLWYNRAAADLIGYEPGEIQDLDDWFARLYPDRHHQIRAIYDAARLTAFPHLTTVSITRKDGQTRTVEFTARLGEHGEIWLVRDVTEERRLARLYAETQKNTGIAGWELDCRAQALYWSPEVFHLFEADLERFTPQLRSFLDLFHCEHRPLLEQALKKACAHGEAFNLEGKVLTLQGREREVRCQGKAELDAAGHPMRLFGWIQDVGAEKESERSRAQLETQLRHAQKLESLGVLAGGIAHDFNNLLTSILGYTSLARLELPAESHLQEYLQEVEKASRRAAQLTQQMLAYSGKGQYHLGPVRLDRLLPDLVPLLRAAVGKRASLELDIRPHLPVLEADEQQLRQVLVSLVNNAAESMPEDRPDQDRPGQDRLGQGRILLRAGLRHLAQPQSFSPYVSGEAVPGWFLFVRVEDNGSGMSQDVQARIFEPFFSTKFAGRGLGMAAVLGIVKGHRGLIHVESALGQGSAVEVLFPLPSFQPDVERDGQAMLPSRGQTLLVVEDEEPVRALARHVLQAAGYQVLTAVDGLQAEEVVRARGDVIQAVLLDLTMPHRGGKETLAALHLLQPNLPVLLMSGYSAEDVLRRFPKEQYLGFLQKPFSPTDLVAFVERHLPSIPTA